MEENQTARIFARACEMKGGERARYLREACVGDDFLLQRLVALLEADERPLTSLDQGACLPAEGLIDDSG